MRNLGKSVCLIVNFRLSAGMGQKNPFKSMVHNQDLTHRKLQETKVEPLLPKPQEKLNRPQQGQNTTQKN